MKFYLLQVDSLCHVFALIESGKTFLFKYQLIDNDNVNNVLQQLNTNDEVFCCINDKVSVIFSAIKKENDILFQKKIDTENGYVLNIEIIKKLTQNIIFEIDEKFAEKIKKDLYKNKSNYLNVKPLDKPHNRIIFGAPGTGKSHQLENELKDFPPLTDVFQRNENLEKIISDEIKNKSVGENNGDWAASVAIKYSSYFKELENWFSLQGPGGSYNDFLNSTFGLSAKQPELMIAAYRGMNIIRKTTISETYERVTFHPNYSYAQFVGTYKPVTKKYSDKTEIEYEFVPGPFLRTLIKAYKTKVNCLLLIEEINRANVAAVFGDVFQLLDRDENGESEYPITTSEDLRNFLAKPENLGGLPENYTTISIPSNMYIWATMNSADQGVQPMDAAFKRRWEFEYLNINNSEKDIDDNMNQIQFPDQKIDWNQLRHLINNRISNNYNINEDKLLGPFFIKKRNKTDEQFLESFKSKVLMYLFEDVCKTNPKLLFAGIDKTKLYFSDIVLAFDKKGVGIFNFSEEEVKNAESEIPEKETQADE